MLISFNLYVANVMPCEPPLKRPLRASVMPNLCTLYKKQVKLSKNMSY